MSTYYTKERKQDYAKRRRAREAKEQAELLDRAWNTKSIAGPRTPAAEIAALEGYIDSLIALRNELQEKHGAEPEWGAPIYGVTMEINKAAHLLVSMRVSILRQQKQGY